MKEVHREVVPLNSIDQRSSFADVPQQPAVEQQLPAAPSDTRFYTRKQIRRLNRNRNKVRRYKAAEKSTYSIKHE